MTKVFFPNFTIKISSPVKDKRYTNTVKRISRRCLAKVIKTEDGYKAKIDVTSTDCLLLPFTSQSTKLKNKTHVFLHNKDEYGNKVLVIHPYEKVMFAPGIDSQYTVLLEDIIISGYIVRQNNIKMFDYEEFVAINEKAPRINNPKIETDKNLFKE